MKNMKKILSLVLAVVMCAGIMMLASCGKDDSYTANNTTWKIGMSGPLTGGAAYYGNEVLQAAQMAVKEINEAGGLFGHNFELLSYDDQHDASKVATGYAAALEAGMQVSLGCVTSAPCAEYKTLSAADNVFFITPSASNDDIPSEKNGYQMCFADGNQGAAAAAYVNEAYAGKTIGILYCSGDNYSQGIYNQFIETLSKSITVKVASFVKDATDFSSQIATLKDCEFVFMPIYYGPASQFMVQAASVENSIKVYYGCDGLDGIDSVEGFDITKIPQEVSYLSHFNASSTDTATAAFVAKYKATYNCVPSQFAAGAYDCVYAIYEALKAAGEKNVSVTMSAEDMCKVLTAQFDGTFTFSGVTGNNMKWTRATSGYGYVAKTATKFVVKEAS